MSTPSDQNYLDSLSIRENSLAPNRAEPKIGSKLSPSKSITPLSPPLVTNDETGTRVPSKEVRKCISWNRLSEAQRLKLFEEIDKLKNDHPSNLRTYSYWEQTNDELVLVRPFVVGSPIILDSALSDDSVLRLGIDLARACQALHRNGIYHQNIKPNNIIIDEHGVHTLVDGLIEPISQLEELSLVEQGLVYASPEQLGSIQHPVGAFSDLYSIGVVLYESLAGQRPFACNDLGELIYNQVSSQINPLPNAGAGLRRALNEVIQRLLRKHPQERYQTCRALIDDLETILLAHQAGKSVWPMALGTTDRRSCLLEPSFIGRVAELEAFRQEMTDTADGDAGLLVVEAISGCGKSRLLDEFEHEAEARSMLVFRGVAPNLVGATSFPLMHGVVECIQKYCQAGLLSLDELDQDQRVALVQALPMFVQALNWETTAEQSETSLGPAAFGEARSISAMCRLFQLLGTANRPAVLIFDDCQWADEATLRLLASWNRYVHSLPVNQRYVTTLLAFREDEVPSTHSLRYLEPKTHLKLAPLDATQVADLAQSMAGELPAEALSAINEMASGSPFMVNAVVRGMVESGALQADSQGWRVDEANLTDMQSSGDAGDLLARRIDLLSEPLVRCLSAGAILGKSFDLRIAHVLTDQSVEAKCSRKFDDELKEAIAKHLIWFKANEHKATFVHDKIRFALLNRLSTQKRRDLHLRAARHLESEASHRVAEIAFHFDASGKHSEALPYALDAAQQARAQHALQNAEQHYLIAQRGQVGRSSKMRLKIQEHLGDVQMLQGKYDRALDAFQQANSLAKKRIDRARLIGKLGELAFKRGDMENASRKIEQALRASGAQVPRSEAGVIVRFAWEMLMQVLHTLMPQVFVHRLRRQPNDRERLQLSLFSRYAHSCWFSRSKFRCLWSHLRNMNLAERYEPTLELAQAYSEHAPAMSLIPFPKRGIEYANRSLRIREDFSDWWGQGQSLHYLGVVLYSAARFRDCIQACREAVRLLEKTGDYWEVHIARFQIAASYYYLGDLYQARKEAQHIHLSGLELGDYQASGMSLDIWARAEMGSPAQSVFDQELQRDRIDTQGTAQLLLGQGVRYMASNRTTQAEQSFRLATQTARKSGIHNAYVLPNFVWLVSALRTQAERVPEYEPRKRETLLWKAKRAAWFARIVSWPFKHNRPHLFRELGLVAAMQGRSRRCSRLLTKSIRLAQAVEADYERSLSEYCLEKLNLTNQTAAQSPPLFIPPNAERLFALGDHLNEGAAQQQVTFSLADRFKQIMTSGREITSALDEDSIWNQVKNAALRLIRGQYCEAIKLQRVGEGYQPVSPSSYPLNQSDIDLIYEAVDRGQTVSSYGQLSDPAQQSTAHSRSSLAAPVFVRGELQACLLVIHSEIAGLFNETEEQLGDFIATIAGAALENAAGFAKLEQLNATLESRVEQRTAELIHRARDLASANKKLKRIALDLTKAQTDLEEAKQRVEQASQAKSDFMATMSHEIRTPMNAVIGMTDMCLNTSLDSQQRSYLGVVKSSAQSLLRILNDILDFSKIEAGKLDLESIPLDVPTVLEESCQLLGINAYKKGLEVILQIDPEIPPRLLGDPGRLQQILVNLLGNAIKFTKSGEIVLAAKLDATDEKCARIHFSVRDTGIGIPQEKQQHIFTSFSQADSSTTRRYGGTGLGLSICARLVQMMNGTIWVESQVNEGSDFQFTADFPITEQRPSNAIYPPTHALESRSVCVAIHSDAAFHALKSQFQACGASCVDQSTCFNVANGPSQYDLSVVDIPTSNISEGDGDAMEEIQKIVELAERHQQRVLVLYPNSLTHLNGHNEDLTADVTLVRFVPKPVLRGDLWNALKSLFPEANDDTETISQSHHDSTNESIALRVLLAEDVEINQRIAVHLLKRMGHEVVVAADGLEALACLEKQDFDVVLMDVEMPQMDGVEATRRIRQTSRGKRIPIIAMTAHVVPDIQQSCEEAGMNDYLSKPLDVDKLKSMLEEIGTGAGNV